MHRSNTDIHESSGPVVMEAAETSSSIEVTDNGQQPDVDSEPDTKVHWILLALSLTIVALSFVLSVPGNERVVLPLINVPLPGLCYTREIFGIPCPGCGLTRCFISLAHGEFSRALRFHPAGVLLFAFVVCQIPYRLTQIWRVGRGQQPIHMGDITWPIYIFLGIMILQWVVKLVGPLL